MRKAIGDSWLDRAGERTGSLADPIGASLEETLQIRVFDAGEGVTQFRRSIALRAGQRTHGLPHLVLQAREVTSGLLPVLSELSLLLTRRPASLSAGATRSRVGSGLAKHVGHAIGLGALLSSEAIRFASQGIELAGSLLLFLSPEEIGGLAKTLSRTTGIGFALPL